MSAAEARIPSPRQISGLWELPLFLLSLPLAAGTAWLLLSGLSRTPSLPLEKPVEAPWKPEGPEGWPEELARAVALAESGRFPESLKRIEALRGQAVSEPARREADLAHAAVLELEGDADSLAAAAKGYAELRVSAPNAEQAAESRLREARASWKLFQRVPSVRGMARLQEILVSVRESQSALTRPAAQDEASFLEGQVLESLGRLQEAEEAFRRVSPARPALKGAALLRIAGCFRKHRPPGLPEAHAAVLEAERQGLPGSLWQSREDAEREVELLAQAWREADDDGRAIEVEEVLERISREPVQHYLHEAEVHERRAEKLLVQASEASDPREAAAARESARAHDLAAGRIYGSPLDRGIPAPNAELLFRAARAFERAGDVEQTVRALERFTERYLDDPRFPQAVYLLGRRYRDLGLYDKALALFEKSRPGMKEERGNVHYVPLSLYEEGICQYLSGAPGSRSRSAEIFGRILDHPDIYPESQTWCDSLFALSRLEFEDAAKDAAARPRARARLSEWLERYPQDARVPQARMMTGLLAWDAEGWAEAAASFRSVADQAYGQLSGPSPQLLSLGRSAALLAAEATYRQGLKPLNPALLAEARERFSDARDLNLGTWRAPWALARMADCSRALGREAEAKGLYDLARFEYTQVGASAGPAPEGTEGLENLIAWRAEVGEWLGRP